MSSTTLNLEQIRNELIEMFGDNLPNIDQEPTRFKYYIEMYLYEKQIQLSKGQ